MARPEKIVSLLPSATEIVCALGLADKLAGVTHECDYPPGIDQRPHLTASKLIRESMTSIEIDHAVRTSLDGHGSIYDLDVELLDRIRPDLILTQELCEVCAVSYSEVRDAARLCAADATVVSLEPNTIEEIFANIMTVGGLTGTKEEAAVLVSRLRERISSVRNRSATAVKRPGVMMLEWLEPPFAPGHWVPEQVEAAGGKCVLGVAGKKSETTTYKEVAESNADVMVLIPCGYSTEAILAQLGNSVFPQDIEALPAVRNDEVWALDASAYFSRPGPRVVDGLEILAKIIHPEIFGEPESREAVRVPAGSLRTRSS